MSQDSVGSHEEEHVWEVVHVDPQVGSGRRVVAGDESVVHRGFLVSARHIEPADAVLHIKSWNILSGLSGVLCLDSLTISYVVTDEHIL